MSQIGATQQSLGWALRLERLLMLGFRRQRFAMAGFAIVAIVSASLVFVGKDKVVRPAAGREWVFVGAEMYRFRGLAPAPRLAG